MPYHRILDNIYLGDRFSQWEMISDGVVPDVIINSTNDVENHNNYISLSLVDEPYKSSAYRIPIEDCADEITLSYVDSVINIIEHSVKKGLSVLIHCYYGINRSVFFLSCYMIRTHRYTMYECYLLFKKVRNAEVLNNLFYIAYLDSVEKKYLGSSTLESYLTT